MSNKYTIRYIKKTPPKTKVKQISYFIKFENGEIHVLTYSNLQRILYNIDANPTIYQNIQIFKVKTYNKLSVLEFTKLLAQKHYCIDVLFDNTK